MQESDFVLNRLGKHKNKSSFNGFSSILISSYTWTCNEQKLTLSCRVSCERVLRTREATGEESCFYFRLLFPDSRLVHSWLFLMRRHRKETWQHIGYLILGFVGRFHHNFCDVCLLCPLLSSVTFTKTLSFCYARCKLQIINETEYSHRRMSVTCITRNDKGIMGVGIYAALVICAAVTDLESSKGSQVCSIFHFYVSVDSSWWSIDIFCRSWMNVGTHSCRSTSPLNCCWSLD